MKNNLILSTDSYKLGHHQQYPEGTQKVYSYFESRGGKFPYTVFFGLQRLLEGLQGQVVRLDDISKALALSSAHFGNNHVFNYAGWNYILNQLEGKLPLRIKAVPEGSVIPTGNVLMTVENTDPHCYWLTNALESYLTHVWYPSTVATLSHTTKAMIRGHLERTADSLDALPFMLHDFGYRGATGDESAAIGGAGHLVNFLGTDTLPAMELALDTYAADLQTLAYSVPATEHSVMTALGREGEMNQVQHVLDKYPSGIVSVVADSYDVYDFVRAVGTTFKDQILARDGKFVVRPDSLTNEHKTPEDLLLWIAERLWNDFPGTYNSKGYRIFDPHVGALWGDGLTPGDIDRMLTMLGINGYSSENFVFGMGGGLLQRGIDRDTAKFAFKSSAQMRDDAWHDVWKNPIGGTKTSKKGRLRLSQDLRGDYETLRQDQAPHDHEAVSDVLETVFLNGEITKCWTFDEIRGRAS